MPLLFTQLPNIESEIQKFESLAHNLEYNVLNYIFFKVFFYFLCKNNNLYLKLLAVQAVDKNFRKLFYF